MSARLEFKPQDCWIGVFWRTTPTGGTFLDPETQLDVWLCLIPMFPLHLTMAWARYD